MTNTLSGRQCALFVAIMTLSSKLLVLPSILYSDNSAAGIFTVIFMFFLEFIFLLYLIKIKKNNPNKSFFEFFSNKIGKTLTKLIILILFIFFILKTLYILSESFTFLKRSLYTEASISVFLICMLPVISALAYRGLKALGRTLEIFYVFIIALIAFCCLVCVISVDSLSFGALTAKSLESFFTTTFAHTFWFGDTLFFMYLIQNVKFTKSTKRQIITHALVAYTIVLTIMTIYFITFQTTSFTHPYAILNIIQFVSDFGTVGKFDIVAISAIMFIIYFQLGMLISCASHALKTLIPFGHPAQPLIAINVFLVLLCYVTFTNSNHITIFYSEPLQYFSLLATLIIPLLFILCSFRQKRRRAK